MPTIRSGGTGSGIDVELLIEKLTDAERTPVESRLNLREVQIQADVSAYNSLKGALKDFQSAISGLNSLTNFATRTATTQDESIFSVSASSVAVPGDTDIKVKQLASSQKLVSGSFTDKDTVVGQGDLQISVGTESFSLKIDNSNSTLIKIRDEINDSASNPGVKASIMTVDDPLNPGQTVSKLVLTAEKSGADNNITVTVTNDATGTDTDSTGLSQLAYDPDSAVTNLTELTPALDAIINVDTFDVSSSTNVFTGVLPGVTITANSVDLDNTYKLNVKDDTAAVKDKITQFVDALNSYNQTYDYLTAVDVEAKEAGLLTGEATARGINTQLIRTVTSVVSEGTGSFSTLASIGITISREGVYELDSEKLASALNSNFDEVSELIAGENGIAKRLNDQLSESVGSGGVLSAKNATLEAQLKDIADQRADLELRLESVEERLRNQFTAMDIIVAQFNNTGDFLTQQLKSISPNNKD